MIKPVEACPERAIASGMRGPETAATLPLANWQVLNRTGHTNDNRMVQLYGGSWPTVPVRQRLAISA